jgi:hypothetical protein
MAQQRAEAPIMMVFLCFKGKLLYPDPNRFATLEGGVMPKEMNKEFQMNLDIWQSKKMLEGLFPTTRNTFSAPFQISFHQTILS